MAGKGDNTAKRTDFKKYWKNYPTKWKRKKDKDDRYYSDGSKLSELPSKEELSEQDLNL